MDSRDSSSSPSMAGANRDADDDGALSVRAALAKEAVLSFNSGKFAECIELLHQLLQKKEDDPKILHNIAIAEFFQGGCSDPRKLLETLAGIKKRSDELAHASGEPTEAFGNPGSKVVLGSKGTNSMVHQFSATNSSTMVYDNEFDTSLTMLNRAIIWFQLQEYSKAYSILESLYQKIEPIDEGTALHVCLLFLDVALASRDPWKYLDVINYVEKYYCVNNLINQGDNGSSVQHQSSNLVAKSSPLPSNSTTTDVPNSDSVASAYTSENSLSRTLSDETLEYETLLSTLDNSGQTLARSSGLQSSNDLLRTPVADQSILTIDLRLKLHLYKVRFLLFTKNFKAAKREAKMAMNIGRGKDSSVALVLKSQLEYARGNHRKAIKLLMASGNRTETGISNIYNNNLGCIYYRLGKYHTSSVFFSKALGNSLSLQKEKPLKLSTFSQDKSLYIIYNCGVQYLACGKPILAARCFHKASLIFYDRPLLWLRIAECCIMALEKGLLKSSGSALDRPEVKVHVIGKGKWRQLILEDGVSRNGQMGFVGRDDLFWGDNKQQPILSMSLARQCLFNALHLLSCLESKYSKSGSPMEEESREAAESKKMNFKTVSAGETKVSGEINSNGDAKEHKGGNSLILTLQNSILDYEDICRRENQMIKQALLAYLAYVELELGNPLKALSIARSLLKHPECSRVYLLLGNMYAAESLCMLNRPKEAAEHLSIYLSGGNNVELPYSEEDCQQWQVDKIAESEEFHGGSLTVNSSSLDESQGFVFLKPDEARGILYANLALLSAIQGDLEQAHRFAMQAMSTIPNSPQAIVTAIYLDLKLGKTQEALARLKKCSHIRFCPGGLNSNSSS